MKKTMVIPYILFNVKLETAPLVVKLFKDTDNMDFADAEGTSPT